MYKYFASGNKIFEIKSTALLGKTWNKIKTEIKNKTSFGQ